MENHKMVEDILYSRPEAGSTHLVEELSRKDLNKEMQEMNISEGNISLSRSKCELCVVKNPFFEGVAVFLCFACEVYVCINCMSDHRTHEGMKVGNKRSESDKEKEGRDTNKIGDHSKDDKTQYNCKGFGRNPKRMRQEENKDREKEKKKSEEMKNTSESESKRMLITFVDELINENDIERKEKLTTKHVNIYDRVKVKEELDEGDCNITGLCGLENNGWVVCDIGNLCIKIFKLGSNVLQRYIRFDSQPWDVTEILEKQNFTSQYSVSGSNSSTVTDLAEHNKKCLIAVTLPWKRQIMFVALNQKPALIHKKVASEKSCYYIQYYDNKIFTVCREDLSSCFVYIKSTEGDTLCKFINDVTFYVPHLAVNSGRVYLAYRSNNKLQCRTDDGQVISENVIGSSRPEGISVDKDNVYVCALLQDKIYKLNPDLTRCKSLLDETTDYIEKPDILCYYRHKLFVSHHILSSLDNFVTVIRLL